MAAFGVGECLHGAVQAPLVADLADPRLLGRYMALSALSWQVGFALGPALGGFALAASPSGTWLARSGDLPRCRGGLASRSSARLPTARADDTRRLAACAECRRAPAGNGYE